jgi:hypothetical protein
MGLELLQMCGERTIDQTVRSSRKKDIAGKYFVATRLSRWRERKLVKAVGPACRNDQPKGNVTESRQLIVQFTMDRLKGIMIYN